MKLCPLFWMYLKRLMELIKPTLSFYPSLPGVEGAQIVRRVFSRAAPNAKQLTQIGFTSQANGT
jgi:hypothetical protein